MKTGKNVFPFHIFTIYQAKQFLSFSVFLCFFLPELILGGLSWMGRLTGIIYEMSLDLFSALNFHFMCNTFFCYLTVSELERRYY